MSAYAPFLNFVSGIVQQAIFIFFAVGAVFTLAAGLLLVFGSQAAFRISERMNRWVSTRAAIRPLVNTATSAGPCTACTAWWARWSAPGLFTR